MNANAGALIGASLPKNAYGPNLRGEAAASYIKQILNEDLPSSDRPAIDRELKWTFILDKLPERKRQKRGKKRSLTRRDREHLGLLKLPRAGWRYETVLPMNRLWKEYMRENLEHARRAPDRSEPDYANYVTVLNKSEFVGAEIAIVRSTVPSYVGIRGIVVLETKATFQIVTSDNKLKIILKHVAVFTIELYDVRLTVFGKTLTTRPGERSVKKLRTFVVPDL